MEPETPGLPDISVRELHRVVHLQWDRIEELVQVVEALAKRVIQLGEKRDSSPAAPAGDC
jgi:hypothetical protein